MSILRATGHWISDLIVSLVYAWPLRLRRDYIYLWATFRLRHRPIKMLIILAALGAMAYIWQWFGWHWGSPYLNTKIVNKIDPGALHTTLRFTANAVFSSLNFLSCVSIIIISRSLRKLIEQDHIQHLMLTPRKIRPSALFFALATRYFPLAFIAVIVMYLDPLRSPFERPPYVFQPPNYQIPPVLKSQYDFLLARQIGDPMNLRWAAINELSILFFCATNLFMDLALAFWIMVRWRVSIVTTILAVVVIGLVSPIGLMYFQQQIREDYMNQLRGVPTLNDEGEEKFSINQFLDEATESARVFFGGEPRDMEYQSVRRPGWQHNHIFGSRHYLITGTFSLLVGWLALAALDRRWRSMVNNPKVDPVFMRRLE